MTTATAPSEHHSIIHLQPGWGYDGWVNPDRTPAEVEADHPAGLPTWGVEIDHALADAASQANFDGEDTIESSLGVLTPGAALYMSYIDNFRGWLALARLISAGRLGPHAHGFSITIFGGVARCADVQPGAMSTGSIGGWIDRTQPHFPGLELIGYTNAGNMGALIGAAGGRRMIRWSAHFGAGRHLCGPGTCGFPQADFTQWDDKGPNGQNFDRSIIPAATLGRIIGHVAAAPHQHANAGIGVDLHTGHWHAHGTPGNFIPADQAHRRVMRATVEFDTHNGQWHIAGDPNQG